MLLGAAKYLAETRNFAGSVAVIFQPAEEGGGGGHEMVKDGMMERFDIAEVYGMHNMPGMPIGHFGSRVGAIMASTDEFTITIKGRGGHAAQPHKTIDPIVIGTQIVTYAYAGQFYPMAIRATGIGWASGVGRSGAILAPIVIGTLVGMQLPLEQNFMAMAIPA
eukprot:gene3589-4471_t